MFAFLLFCIFVCMLYISDQVKKKCILRIWKIYISYCSMNFRISKIFYTFLYVYISSAFPLSTYLSVRYLVSKSLLYFRAMPFSFKHSDRVDTTVTVLLLKILFYLSSFKMAAHKVNLYMSFLQNGYVHIFMYAHSSLAL